MAEKRKHIRRGLVQALATLLSNIHITNFFRGTIHQGSTKRICVPGLNCYSCPAATGACPIGSFQAVVGSTDGRISYYVSGLIILFGTVFGRLVCGFLCPFGWIQDLLYKIPSRKLSTKRITRLTYLKYFILVLFVIVLPTFLVDSDGLSTPYFCKYICPAGILEGAIPLGIANEALREALGILFSWKLLILITVVVFSVLAYRPFCKYICPLGALYSLFNSISFVTMRVDSDKCTGCTKCIRVCRMDVDITKNSDHRECIRCGECSSACPTGAIETVLRFNKQGDKKNESKKTDTDSPDRPSGSERTQR